VNEAGVDPQYARAYLTALVGEIRRFEQDFSQASPAFAFVQLEDWEWIPPFLESLSGFIIIEHDSVGSRNMLLLANRAGAELLSETDDAPPT